MIRTLMPTETGGFPAVVTFAHKTLRLLSGGLAICALTACGPAPPPYKPVADVKQLMQGVVDPSADGVWQSVAIIFTKNHVEERRPRTQKEWEAVRAHAMTLAEAGNLLMMPGRAKDGNDWMKFAQELVDASV